VFSLAALGVLAASTRQARRRASPTGINAAAPG
jgi:hypothetical protein